MIVLLLLVVEVVAEIVCSMTRIIEGQLIHPGRFLLWTRNQHLQIKSERIPQLLWTSHLLQSLGFHWNHFSGSW